MGFGVAYGPEVEDEWHNFIALNIGPEHPARDPRDNFYIDDNTLLRSQTSTIQIRVMEKSKPPIRVVAPGRVYRPDTVDATHMYMFHQLEALVVDEGVTMVDMKTTIEQFIHTFFASAAWDESGQREAREIVSWQEAFTREVAVTVEIGCHHVLGFRQEVQLSLGLGP